MLMQPAVRKIALTVHISASVGWAGAVAVFLAHALVSLLSTDDQAVRSASLAMGIAAWFVIVPLSLASLVTGLIQGLGTAWGVVRHYWVLFKLLLTVVATGVLLLKLAPISFLADAAAQPGFSHDSFPEMRRSLVLHAAGGLVVLLAAATLAIYKPAGRVGSGLPRWVKLWAGVIGTLLLLVLIGVLAGAHGLKAHASAGA